MRNLLSIPTLLILLHAASVAAQEEAEKPSPNIVVFLTDDLGWGDLGCYGHPVIKSPNLDRFAQEGLRLTQCYAACAVCSPSRSAILTGRTPYRNGVWRWIPSGSEYHLRESEITIAELLQSKGYDTCHTGKWHLNGKFNSPEQPQPDDHGYDHWLATQNNAAPNHMNPTNYVRNGVATGRMEGPSAVIAVEEAVGWLKRREDSTRPFFLTVWTHEPHLPIESAEQFMEPYADFVDSDLKQHHGNITQLDHAFGQLMRYLDQSGQRDNTLVIFTSDNGPEGNGLRGRTRGSTGGLRGRKRHSHEGGIRVPGIIRWPGHVRPGSTSDTPVIGSDIFTTICDIVEIPLPSDRTIDGASIVPVFSEQPIQRNVPLYWRNHLAPEKTRVALREGDWKILASDDLKSFELYNIADDWQEAKDLSESHPEKLNELQQKLVAHDAAVLAEGPDWWKKQADTPRRPRQPRRLKQGTDLTDEFDVILGGTVEKSVFGYRLRSNGESLAFKRLPNVIKGRFRITVSYRSAVEQRTQNGAIAISAVATNADSVKIGTAMGLNQHVAFQGDWSKIGSLGKQPANIRAEEEFEVIVEGDTRNGEVTARINNVPMPIAWPRDLKEIHVVGIYVKGTVTDFSKIRWQQLPDE